MVAKVRQSGVDLFSSRYIYFLGGGSCADAGQISNKLPAGCAAPARQRRGKNNPIYNNEYTTSA